MKNYINIIESIYKQSPSIEGFITNAEFLKLYEELKTNAFSKDSKNVDVEDYCSFVLQCFYEMKDLGKEIDIEKNSSLFFEKIISDLYLLASENNSVNLRLVILSHFFYLNFFIFNTVQDYLDFAENKSTTNKEEIFKSSLVNMYFCLNLFYSCDKDVSKNDYSTINSYLLDEIYRLEKTKFLENTAKILSYFGSSLSEFLYVNSQTELLVQVDKITFQFFSSVEERKGISEKRNEVIDSIKRSFEI